MPSSSWSVTMPRVLLIGLLPVEDEHLADALHRGGAGALAKRFERLFALVAIHGRSANLDQLVRAERAIDFLHHFIRKAFAADDDDGLQGMGPCFEHFAL